jgi:hypothetical protein
MPYQGHIYLFCDIQSNIIIKYYGVLCKCRKQTLDRSFTPGQLTFAAQQHWIYPNALEGVIVRARSICRVCGLVI